MMYCEEIVLKTRERERGGGHKYIGNKNCCYRAVTDPFVARTVVYNDLLCWSNKKLILTFHLSKFEIRSMSNSKVYAKFICLDLFYK